METLISCFEFLTSFIKKFKTAYKNRFFGCINMKIAFVS